MSEHTKGPGISSIDQSLIDVSGKLIVGERPAHSGVVCLLLAKDDGTERVVATMSPAAWAEFFRGAVLFEAVRQVALQLARVLAQEKAKEAGSGN